MTQRKPNHLQGENSPYLLQHAYNPVDWHPWGDAALQKAGRENRLMVISIGYAACHWCHVMEHESFEDDEVAALMNGQFVPVKVDREERPDIDQVYMPAAYMTTGRGGWPLNVIALPDQRPVFAGTYYSKRDWLQILNYFSEMFRSHPGELEQQAAELLSGMKKGNGVPGLIHPDPAGDEFLREVATLWKEDLDFVHGGTFGAPKFPMPANLACLQYLGSRLGDRELKDYLHLTLDKIASGGINDQLGGGFCRYSVDGRWHVPHFEKMLYDNAQLAGLYAEAYAATRNNRYRQVAEETIAFVNRELTGPEGLFYSSLDADSEGREGAFYTWKSEEIEKYLGTSAGMFMDYFSCESGGNWENAENVLRIKTDHADFAREHNLPEDQLSSFIDVCRDQLLTVRGNRPRPATDDKALTCWNALMISALVAAGRACRKQDWLEKAFAAATFYREEMLRRNGKLWRSYKAGSFTVAGFLDDYALLAAAFNDLYQATFDVQWLLAAGMLTEEAIRNFTSPDGDFFNLSSAEEPRLIRDTVELSDNVVPASNSVMASNLYMLGCLLGREDYTRRAERMAGKMITAVRKNPSFHANWTCLLARMAGGQVEVAIIGENHVGMLREFDGHYLPGLIFSGGDVKTPAERGPARHVPGKTMVYVCRGKSCFPPVGSVAEALDLLKFFPG